jgi:hypothetical protein
MILQKTINLMTSVPDSAFLELLFKGRFVLNFLV